LSGGGRLLATAGKPKPPSLVMSIYEYGVLILFALAIADLVVGVSNDAVNVLNSSVGSRAALKIAEQTKNLLDIFEEPLRTTIETERAAGFTRRSRAQAVVGT